MHDLVFCKANQTLNERTGELSLRPAYFFSIYSEMRGSEAGRQPSGSEHLQAVHNRAAFPTIVFLLPLVHLADELQEGALGHRRVSVHGPAQELELLHHPVPVLGLQRVGQQAGSGEKAGIIPGAELQRVDPTYSSQWARGKEGPACK